MIKVIPSITIRRGRVVKMRKGDPLSEKAYDENPLDLAIRFAEHGIDTIHLVDLDGAEQGSPKNYHVLQAIAGHTNLKIGFTGGISVDGDIGKSFEYGASHITASSIAVSNPELFASWIISYGREKITLGADVVDIHSKKIAYRGWQKESESTLFDHVRFFYERGLKYMKTTDVSHDGILEGPVFSFYREIKQAFPDLNVLASGGVRGVDDIKRLEDEGIFAVIFGKAFYEGILTLKDLESFIVRKEA
jgi:phosphoribosylformimino-5-aminoimidazole carboxamide ribotide isomerase